MGHFFVGIFSGIIHPEQYGIDAFSPGTYCISHGPLVIGSLEILSIQVVSPTVFTQPLRSLPQISGCPAFSAAFAAAFFYLGYSRSFPRLEGPWLVGDDILLSSIGIIISQYKDPYEPTSIFQGFDRSSFFMESYPDGGFLTITYFGV